ncbi:MAG TPA: fasciclin domain-containing protein [Ktedonobacteraceae bacterium]
MANLINTLQEEGTFTTFTRAIKMTEIVTTLREPGAYTMFAPTDAAFAKMKAEQVEGLFEDYYNMSKLVKYHIVLGIYRTTALLDMIFLKTMEGQRLIIKSSAHSELNTEALEDGTDAHGYVVRDTVTSTLLESIQVDGARIIRGNVSADNGVIHVIDKVLVPRFMIL